MPFYPFAARADGRLLRPSSARASVFSGLIAHPAKVFMGDTGSLAIGGMMGVVAICCKQELLLVVVGGVFVIEAVSVILAGAEFQTHGQAHFCHVAAASSFRANGLEGEHRHRSVLDSVNHLRPAWPGDTEIEMKNARYKNQNSRGSWCGPEREAAALLLKIGEAHRSRCSIAPRRRTYSNRPSTICGHRVCA